MNPKSGNKKNQSFTLIELLIVLSIIIIVLIISIPALKNFQKKSTLESLTDEIINTLRFSQNKTLASEKSGQYGVYFDNINAPNQYILFKGIDFNSRDPTFDEIHKFSDNVRIYQISLGDGKEVVFKKVTGETNTSGNIVIGLISDSSQLRTIYVENSGKVGLTTSATPLDTSRIKDSRHIHLAYNRDVKNDTFLQLVFPDYPNDNYDIVFQNYLNLTKTEFYWEGSVLVGPADSKTEQKLIIHTHNLTETSAQFCIHRDRRYNDKALQIKIFDDGSGNLISYAADGQESKGTSIYLLGDPQQQ